MRRWLLLPLALGLAAFAAYALLSGPSRPVASPSPDGPPERPRPTRTARDEVPDEPAGHAEIRDESRERLREILREADREERR